MVKNSQKKSYFSIYLLSYVMLCFIWRILPFEQLFNILLAILICTGVYYNFRLKRKKVWFSSYFILIIIGLFISILFNSINIGSFYELLQLNSEYTSLKYVKILEGLGLFFVIILNIRDIEDLKIFYKIQYILGLFFITLWLLGLSDNLLNILSVDLSFETAITKYTELDISRYAFETLDETTFGSICSVLATFSLFLYFKNRNIIYLAFLFLLFLAVFYTISMTALIRLFFCVLIFFMLSTESKFLKFLYLVPVILVSTLILYFSDLNTGIFFRFNELYVNLNDWSETGTIRPRDSFQYRIIRSLLGVPDSIYGWMVGSGGIQTARFGNSADHIEYTNWLWQYGLITFVPLMLFFRAIIKKLLYYSRNLLDKNLASLNLHSLMIIIGMMLSMFGNPQFYYLWIWLGLCVASINVTKNSLFISK